MPNRFFYSIIFLALLFLPSFAGALSLDADSDTDGLTDFEELEIFGSDPMSPDTDQDGYQDGHEVRHKFDPNSAGGERLEKKIQVSLQNQSLTYSLGKYSLKTIKVSTGDRKHPTPKGSYSIIVKKPLVTYKGADYFYPNTRWNMMFKRGSWGNLYIHGAYWHNKFGQRMSHGCVNVSYQDMESLYNWADEGTTVVIE